VKKFGWEGATSRMIRQSEDLPVMFAEKIFFVVKEVKRDAHIVKARFFLCEGTGFFILIVHEFLRWTQMNTDYQDLKIRR